MLHAGGAGCEGALGALRVCSPSKLSMPYGPPFAKNGWVVFGPYRRGQGLSASVGKYLDDEIAAATFLHTNLVPVARNAEKALPPSSVVYSPFPHRPVSRLPGVTRRAAG